MRIGRGDEQGGENHGTVLGQLPLDTFFHYSVSLFAGSSIPSVDSF